MDTASLPYNPFERKGNSPLDPPLIEWSEDAIACQIAERCCDHIRYTNARGEWSLWNRYQWAADSTLHVQDEVRRFCRELAPLCDDKRLAQRIASEKTVASVLRLLRADQALAMRPEQWDADPWLLNTPGGIVDLRTGALGASRRSCYCTKATAVTPGGDCPLWLAFLRRVTGGDAELVAFIHRMCGYILTGLTREHALFLLFGGGANGKSVFISTFSGILGPYARTAAMDTFTETKYQSHPTELAGLQGARLVTATETQEGRRWNEERVKALTGSDRIAARFMRADYFEYTPAFKLVIAGNHKPSLRTVDEAMRRRIQMLPFTVTIPEAERDPQLTERLRTEWTGILQWAIDGCLEWQRTGLSVPEVVREAGSNYLQAEDTVQAWIDDCCESRPGAWSASTTLYSSWQQYAQASGEVACSQKRFASWLEAKGFQPHRTTGARGFNGIRMRNDA